ncbi:MAG TPA: SpoIIE family protein phosphatase, partial [Armatimonadota bacterium]
MLRPGGPELPTLEPRPKGRDWRGYLAAVAFVGLMTLVLQESRPYMELINYPVFYVLVMMASAYLFGEGPALLAFLLCFLAFAYYSLSPGLDLPLGSQAEESAAKLVAFLMGSVTACLAMLKIRNANRDLRQSHRVLEAVLEHVPEGIAIADADSSAISSVSRHGLELLGQPPESRGPWPVEASVDAWGLRDAKGGERSLEETPLWRALRQGEVVSNEEWQVERPDGRLVSVIYNAGPITSRSGEIRGAIAAWRDITHLTEARRTLEEALHRQHYIAEQLQRALLPESSKVLRGLEVAGAYLPAYDNLLVGGDFYDAFETATGQVALLVGDVSGKGLEAAALTAAARNMIRGFAYATSSAAEALTLANAALYEQFQAVRGFVTVFLGLVDPATGVLGYVSAGHCPAVIRRSDGTSELTKPTDTVVGAIRGYGFRGGQSYLGPGDRIVVYTDGLEDAKGPSGRFGADRIRACLTGKPTLGAADQELADLLHQAKEWSEGRFG